MYKRQAADRVLGTVGLAADAHRAVRGYSLGMRQRLALAVALLGDPQILVLDEPANGLDPEGIAWLRAFLRGFARQGRTVLVSSHLLAEVAQSVDEVVVIAKGRLRGHGTLEQVLGGDEGPSTEVRSQDDDRLARVLQAAGHAVTRLPAGGLLVLGVSPREVGEIAHDGGVYLVKLSQRSRSLEQAFFALTGGEQAE